MLLKRWAISLRVRSDPFIPPISPYSHIGNSSTVQPRTISATLCTSYPCTLQLEQGRQRGRPCHSNREDTLHSTCWCVAPCRRRKIHHGPRQRRETERERNIHKLGTKQQTQRVPLSVLDPRASPPSLPPISWFFADFMDIQQNGEQNTNAQLAKPWKGARKQRGSPWTNSTHQTTHSKKHHPTPFAIRFENLDVFPLRFCVFLCVCVYWCMCAWYFSAFMERRLGGSIVNYVYRSFIGIDILFFRFSLFSVALQFGAMEFLGNSSAVWPCVCVRVFAQIDSWRGLLFVGINNKILQVGERWP